MRRVIHTFICIAVVLPGLACGPDAPEDPASDPIVALHPGKGDADALYRLKRPAQDLAARRSGECPVNTPCEYEDALRHSDAAYLAVSGVLGRGKLPPGAFAEIAAYRLSTEEGLIELKTTGRVRIYLVRLSDREGSHHEGSAILVQGDEYLVIVYPLISQCYGVCQDRGEARVDYTVAAQYI